MMDKTCNSLFNRENLALYRYQRYQQSLVENKNFYFGPFSLLLFGASSFLYELMPSNNNGLKPDLATISSFFGAKKSGNTWVSNGKERIPPNWTNRVDPYTIPKVGNEIYQQYMLHPVQFGGNTGNGQFDVLSGPNGKNISDVDASSVTCFLYQLATERVPSSLNGFVTPTVNGLALALTKLNPIFKNLGCPIRLT